jgi:hypothetical protein
VAKCKYCSKSGFFFKVSKEGLCKNCEPVVITSVNRHVEIIQESNDIIEKTKKFETKMSRYGTMIYNLKQLNEEYHSKGIEVVNIEPKKLLQEVKFERKKSIEEEALIRIEKAMDKAEFATTINAKLNNANKALLILKEFNNEYKYENAQKEQEIKHYIYQSQLDNLINKAEKEEFKGNVKKTLEKYLETLYFVKNDEYNDTEDIEKYLEEKIEKLKLESA